MATRVIAARCNWFSRPPCAESLVAFGAVLQWAVYLSTVWALLFVPMSVLYINEFQIKPEERALSSLFGPEYAAYKERVRRWL
jgi:protein-S-isoprenylcysteine O-methyltransferase Ste14